MTKKKDLDLKALKDFSGNLGLLTGMLLGLLLFGGNFKPMETSDDNRRKKETV